MGLYISHLDTVMIKEERSLYVYLLDYGWPDGQWESLFKRHFMKMSDLAADSGAVVIGSQRGVHFGNEVLNWHKVGNLDAESILPGLLITKTHPDYFSQIYHDETSAKPNLDRLLVIPLKYFCWDEDTFVSSIERVFHDLRSGLELKDFAIAQHDARTPSSQNIVNRISDAIELKPGAFGFNIDLKALFFRR